jgi:enoyl-CoA hydratase/carnithine racemase
VSTPTERTEPTVLVGRQDRVGILTLNRPEARNALNNEVASRIADALDELEADDDIWVIVITGAGDRAFCAGQDLKVKGARAPQGGGWGGIVQRTIAKPFIAAVNGAAMGGGLEICLASDCVVADEHATFALPEVKRGLMAAAGGLERLPRRIPPVLAMEMILTGRAISAARALELGLINRVVPSGQCLPAAIELAEEICLNAPLSVRYSKAVVRASISVGEAEAVESLSELKRSVTESEDSDEGRLAFVEKRAPMWKGR